MSKVSIYVDRECGLESGSVRSKREAAAATEKVEQDWAISSGFRHQTKV
jgi:hypothetical protein